MDQKILDALKTINDKLGGTNDPNENWGSLLQEIAQNVGSGGGPVTAGDVSFDPDETYADDTIGSFGKGVHEYLVNNPIEAFVITLTPTAQDFSGTMDQTPAEIKTAYEQGSRIRFEIPSLYAAVDATQYIVTADRMQAAANITYEVLGIGDVLIQVITSSTDSTYTTKIFPLTPIV